MFEYTDPYQMIRMHLIWPIVVGCIAFYAVRFIASTVDGRLSRWQSTLCAVTGIMAAVVTSTLARYWSGSGVYWLAFTVGLGFMALVLLGNAFMAMIAAGKNDDET